MDCLKLQESQKDRKKWKAVFCVLGAHGAHEAWANIMLNGM